MNAGREVLRKMLVAASVLAACSWLAPSLFAQTGTDPAAGRAQKPAVSAGPLRSSLPAEKEKAVAKLGRLPMYFEENRGQTDSRVKFLSRGRGYTLFLTEDEAVLALRKKPPAASSEPPAKNKKNASEQAVLRMKLAGANSARVSGEEQLPGKIYRVTGGQTGPLSGNATYKRVKYAQAYPGIDLMYYGDEKRLEFDFVVAPHADPNQIRLSFSGAEKIKLTKHGELSLRVSGEEVRLKKPVIYQERNGQRTEIAGGYVLTGKGKREAIFNLAPYDLSLPLVIDPAIDFATYLGGTGNDYISAVRVIPTGEIYLLGSTQPSTGFPSTQTIPPPGTFQLDCFVSKLSADGSALLYSVIFPATQCSSMAVDLFGTVHLSFSDTFQWGIGSFLCTLTQDNTGALTLTPLQGAGGFDSGPAQQMQVDSQGNVYMVILYYPGNSNQLTYGLLKVDASGQLMGSLPLLVPGTLPGGGFPPAEQVTGLAVDDAGHAFVIGGVQTAGRITPTPNAFQPLAPNSNCGALPFGFTSWCDGFVMEVDTNTPNNFTIAYASYLGGSGSDYLGDIAVGFDGALYITGQTSSLNFPTTPGAYFGNPSSPGYWGFVVKLDLAKWGSQQLVLGTLFGPGLYNGESIVVLPGGLPAILGNQSSFYFEVDPLYSHATNYYAGGPFVIVFSNDGSSLVFLSLLQPDGANSWNRMASNGSGTLYVAGHTTDNRLGLPGAYQENLAGGYDGLVRGISGIASNSPPIVDLGPPITVSQPQFTLDCGNTLFCDISDPDGDPLVSYRWIGPNGFTVTSTSAPPVASVQLHGGSNQISLIVTDDQGAVGFGTLTVDVMDVDPPVVFPPPDLQTHSTEAGGARGNASSVLHNFLFGSAIASDTLDPNPVALPPQADFGAGPVDVNDQTLFPLGSTMVTFRFRDGAGNEGAAVATVTITPNQAPSLYLSYSPFVATVAATSPAGAYFIIYAYANDAENDPLSFSWSGSITGLTLYQSTNYEQLVGVLPIGVHPINVTVTDGHGGSASGSITITVLPTNTNTGTGPQTVFLFDDNPEHAQYSSYIPGNPLGGHLITLTFSDVQKTGLSHFRSRSDLVPPPPAGMQTGSPPWYYDIATTAVYSGTIDVCVAIRGMSFANPSAIQLYQLQGAIWTALPSTLTPGSRICASTPSLGTFAIFYPEVPETAISTIAGTGVLANSIDGPGGDPSDDAPASGLANSIALAYPRQGAYDRARNYFYFSDGNFYVRRLNLNTGDLTIVFGNGFLVGGFDGPGGDPRDEFVEGTNPLSAPGQPIWIALDALGNLYYRDANTCQVRKVDFTANTVNTVAGDGTCGFSGDGGPALQASLVYWGGIAVDSLGNLFLAESTESRIRRVDAATGDITTVAGNGSFGAPAPGVAATLSPIAQPETIAFDAQGHLLVTIAYNGVARISPGADSQINGGADEILTIAVGDWNSTNSLPFDGDGGTATRAFVQALRVAVASDGALILTDGNRIRRVSPGADGVVTGAPDEMVTTIAGYRYAFSGIGIFNGDTYATMATLAFPSSAFEDAQGRIIVVDSNNNRIRRFGLSPFLASGPGNWPPLADSQSVSTSFNTPLPIVLTGSDLDNDPLTFVILSQPVNGSLSGTAPNLTYTPNPGFQGTDTFTFKVNDGKVDSNLAFVTIAVQPPPSADLSVSATHSPDPVNTGSNLTYTVTATNNGPSDATGVILNHQLASSVNFVSASPSQGTCTTPAVGSTGTVSCDLGALAVGASATVTLVVTPTVAGLQTSLFTLSGNEPDPNGATAMVKVTVQLGPAVINITEQIVVTDAATPLPSAMIGVNENITVTDGPAVLPSAMIGVNENITVTDAATPLPSAMIGVNENIAVTDATAVIPQDNTPPVVTPPANIVIGATEAGGARGNIPQSPDSQALASFLAGATATDNIDPNPVQQQPQIFDCVTPALATPADNTTLFPLGQSCVIFSFRDVSGNIGTAGATVTVNPPIGAFVPSGRVPITPTDANNVPMPLEATFAFVTQPGLITAIPVVPPPIAPPGSRFQGAVYDLATTALFTPPVDVCFLGSGFSVSNRLVHFENGSWVDVTSAATSTQVCGVVNSLSPFGVVTPLNNPPSLTLPGNLTVEATSAAGASVSFSATASDPEDGTFAPVCTPVSGATFPLGATTVNCSATDAAGAQATGSFTITVVDTTPPVLSLPANITAAATSSAGAAVNYSATASDLVSGAIAPNCSPAPGATFAIGTTTVNCTATDAHNNSASGSFTVTVNLGTPRISGAIAAKGRDSAGNFYVDLRLTNTGDGHARNLRLTSLAFRTLSGTGTVGYNTALSPPLPLNVGSLDASTATVVRLYLNVPGTVTRFSITEGGTLQNVAGTASSFSLAQSVIP